MTSPESTLNKQGITLESFVSSCALKRTYTSYRENMLHIESVLGVEIECETEAKKEALARKLH